MRYLIPMNATPENPPEKRLSKWLALVSPAEVFGPFTREELKTYVEAGRIASTAQFFESQESIEEKTRVVEAPLQATVEALQKELGEVRGALETLEKQNADLRIHEKQWKEGAKEAEALRQKIAERDGWLSTLSTEISTTRAEAAKKEDENRALRERLETLARVEQDREALTAEVSQKEAEIKSLKETADMVHRVETQREELRAALATAEREAESLKASLKAEREKIAGMEAREKRVAEVLQGVKVLAGELGTRLNQLEEPQKPEEPQETVKEAEIVDAVESSTETGNRNRLASMEAQAMKELKMLRMRGAGGLPAWGRKRS